MMMMMMMIIIIIIIIILIIRDNHNSGSLASILKKTDVLFINETGKKHNVRESSILFDDIKTDMRKVSGIVYT
jgi:hypothetical protein